MKKTAKLIFFNVLVFLGILACIDPFFKIENPDNIYLSRSINLREYPPFSTKNWMPSDAYMKKNQNLEQKNYQIRTDENGYIIGENNLMEQEDSVDIIFFGGSTTECFLVEEAFRFPYFLNQHLRNNNLNIKVLNGGFSGSHSYHSTVNLLTKGIPLSPKIVVLMHNINDLVLLTKTGDYHSSPDTRSIIKLETLSRKNWTSRLYKMLSSVKNFLFPNIYLKIHNTINYTNPSKDEWKTLREVPITIDFLSIAKKFELSLMNFIQLARTNNIQVVLMTQFNRFQIEDNFIRKTYQAENSSTGIDYDTFCIYYQNFNQKIRDVAKRENLLLIDLDRAIPKDSTFITDAVHLNNQGSQLVAEVIGKYLVEKLPGYQFNNANASNSK